jgi:hypothetical protein
MNVFVATIFKQPGRLAPRFFTLAVGVLASTAGCTGQPDSLPVLKVYEVKGKVLLADGKPLDNGSVYFVPTGELTITPNAVVGPDGTFSVVTGGSGDGAPPGEYKVRVEAAGAQPGQKSRKPLFPFKYTDEDSSGILVTVRPQPNQLEPFLLK